MKEKLQYLLFVIILFGMPVIFLFGFDALFNGAILNNNALRLIVGIAGLAVGYCVCKVLFGKEEK